MFARTLHIIMCCSLLKYLFLSSMIYCIWASVHKIFLGGEIYFWHCYHITLTIEIWVALHITLKYYVLEFWINFNNLIFSLHYWTKLIINFFFLNCLLHVEIEFFYLKLLSVAETYNYFKRNWSGTEFCNRI